jgi:hypothetical protein
MRAIKEREDAVPSLEFRWNERDWDQDSPTGKLVPYDRSWWIIWDNDKFRRVEAGDRGPFDTVPTLDYSMTVAYNGYREKSYSPRSGPVKYPMGEVETRKNANMCELLAARPLVLCYRFREFLSHDSERLDGPVTFSRERLDGKDCVVVQWRLKPKAFSYLRKVWFDRARALIPIREEDKWDTKVLQHDITYARNEAHLVPTTWAIHAWAAPKKLTLLREAKVTKCMINPSIAPETFELAFPPGTYVFDRDTKTDFILRADGSQRPVSAEEWRHGATYESLLNSEPPKRH